MTLFLWYPKCSTCQKANKWLEENGVKVQARHIVEENPTKEELEKIWRLSDLPLKKFFNTSGILYREMDLKNTLLGMSEMEMLEVLSTNGMLVKRPLLYDKKGVLVGFKEKEWEEFFRKSKIGKGV